MEKAQEVAVKIGKKTVKALMVKQPIIMVSTNKAVKQVEVLKMAAKEGVRASKAGKQLRKEMLNGEVKRIAPPLNDCQLQELGIRVPKLFINYSVFAKTTKEKIEFKKVKKEHHKALKKAGFNPNQRMNISEPSIMSSRV